MPNIRSSTLKDLAAAFLFLAVFTWAAPTRPAESILRAPIRFAALGEDGHEDGWDRIEDFDLDPAGDWAYAVSRNPLTLLAFDASRKLQFRIPLYDKMSPPRSMAVCEGVLYLLEGETFYRWPVLESPEPEPVSKAPRGAGRADRVLCGMDGNVALIFLNEGVAWLLDSTGGKKDAVKWRREGEDPRAARSMSFFSASKRPGFGGVAAVGGSPRRVLHFGIPGAAVKSRSLEFLPDDGAEFLADVDFDGWTWLIPVSGFEAFLLSPEGEAAGRFSAHFIPSGAAVEKARVNSKGQLFLHDRARTRVEVFDLPLSPEEAGSR